MLPTEHRINPDRFWESIETSASIGPNGRGLGRLALGDSDKEMRDLFVRWCRDAKLTIYVDFAGNILARRAGTENSLPAVLFGSHLDTQEAGGRFDGVLGVLGGLEVIRKLNDIGYVTRRPIQLVNWTNEEGARFSPPMLGSGCFVGVHDINWAHAIVSNDNGKPLRSELERIGYLGENIVDSESIDSYFELHIEQGPVLEKHRTQIGIVANAATVHGFRFEFKGETAHAGTRPMEKRRNALVAAARLAAAIDDIGLKHGAEEGMATTARIAASPNRPGILSNFCELVGDVRHPDPTISDAMFQAVEDAAADAANISHCDYECTETWNWGGKIFDPGLVNVLRTTATNLGYTQMDITSQAGHDAYFMAKAVPTAMIFVPCADGITHHPDELVTPEEAVSGANMLLHVVTNWADR